MNAMKKLMKFDGSGDVEHWIDKFEFAMVVDDVAAGNKAAQYLTMCLDGPAYDAWKGMKKADQTDAEKIKSTLHSTFGLRRSVAWRKLIGRRVSMGESLDTVCEEMHKWAKIVVTAADADPASTVAMTAFVEALPAEVSQKVRVMCGASASRDQILSAAKEIWPDVQDGATETVAAAARPTSTVEQTSRRPGRDREADPRRPRHCFGCGEMGHFISDILWVA